MEEVQQKYCKESLVIKTSRVFPIDTNNNNTLYGGKLMSYLDDIASISASRHSRCSVVTASTDSVDFLMPIRPQDSFCMESYVSAVGKSSIEVFVKIVAEDLKTGDRRLAVTCFITFIALDENGKPKRVPEVVPQSEEEIMLFNTAKQRIDMRKERRKHSEAFAKIVKI
ncbi:MAG: acyl-CoA thioester hydrolase [Bacillus sp. (in: firmicutes)]|uniref:acyl-CoA thioesterase n=1 Tax=Bacillus sp. 1NLA3E TaxID=666686 RepID=UPI000247EA47|nr:acyl-CoA thioesterase [Bacillus sp. 1NLA3E]AGK52135.1 acyl-CoA thioester hydrolase [Bacillus sp. 1NLA3E]MDF2903875.1 acyl-CoA thioester hydrolase [Bacillus sp. (in: firmicutes)]